MGTNGALSPSELTTVQTSTYLGVVHVLQLANATATAYLAARTASGNILSIAAPDGAYRTLATQAEMRSDWYAHNYTRHNLDPTSTVPPAQAGQSSHGLGICVDMANGAADAWMWEHGAAYGFGHPLAGDANHWQHNGLPGSSTPTPTGKKGQFEMELYTANPPATIPAKYLALNAGLVPGKPIYELIPAVGIPRVTQDQNLVMQWAQSIFLQAGNTAAIPISWGWFDQLFDQQYAIAHSLGAS